MASNAPSYVSRDRELEAAQTETTERLAEHRWHWTLNEANPERVSLREYARSVGRHVSGIARMVNGYAAWKVSSPGSTPGAPETLDDFIRQASYSAERNEAVEAVSAATGKGFGNVAKHHGSEVREVLATAQDRAERKGTTVSEELPRVATSREKARQAAQRERRERQEAKTFFLVQVEGHLGSAIRQLRQALELVRDVDMDAEQVEMLEHTLDTLRTLVRLIDVRLTGTTGIDWDAELAAVMKE